MFSFNLVRWVKSMWRRRRGSTIVNKKPRYRLAFEELETRLAPAGLTHVWTGAGGSGAWNNAANWLAGTPAPTAASVLDNFVFDSRGAGVTTTNNNIPGLIVNSIQISGVTAATGGYTITGNLITLGDPSAPGSGSILVAANLPVENIGLDIQLAATSGSQQFFTINSGTTLTYSGRLSGRTGSQLTKEGTGTLSLTNDNAAYVGPFNIDHDAGIVSISNGKALGGVKTSAVQSVTLTGATAATTFTVGFGATVTGPISYTGTTADALAVQNALTLLMGAGGFVFVTQSNAGSNETFTITFGGTKASAAQVLVSPSITAGPGSASAANVVIGGVATSNGVTVGNNSQLQINNTGATAIPNPLTLFGPGVSANGSLLNVAGNNTWAGTVSMGTNTSYNITAGTTLTINNTVSDLGAPFTVTKIGQGNLIFATANTYRGSTTVNDGILTIENPLALGSVPTAGTTVNRTNSTAGTLRLLDPSDNGFTVNNVVLTLNGPGFGGNGALENFQGNNTWNGPITLGSPAPTGFAPTIQVDQDPITTEDSRLFITGVISDVIPPTAPFNLTKTGTGDLVLSPTNNVGVGTPNLFRGNTTVIAGTLTLRDSQALGPVTKRRIATWQSAPGAPSYNNGAIVTVQNGATLSLESNVGHVDSITGTINRLNVASPLSITGDGYNGVGALRSVSGINTYNTAYVTGPVQDPVVGTSFPAGLLTVNTTYYYVITALDGYGESLASNEQSYTVVSPNRTASLSWNAVPGATAYKVFRTTAAGVYTSPSLVATVIGATSYKDTGTATIFGAPPGALPNVITLNGNAAIGVETEPNQSANASYFTNDYSLTITGGFGGGVQTTTAWPALTTPIMSKVGTGHLILPNPNVNFFGSADIKAGWVTIQDPDALGLTLQNIQEVQPTDVVETGAALMFRPFAPGTSFNFAHNLVLNGQGIVHPFGLINFGGALENLAGVNTVSGNISISGNVGIGVEQLDANVPSDLTINGEIVEQPVTAINVSGDAAGNRFENDNVIDTGSLTGGTITINADVKGIPDDLRVYLGDYKNNPGTAILVYDSTTNGDFTNPTNRNLATVTVNYTATTATATAVLGGPPAGTNWNLGPVVTNYGALPSTFVTIVMNQGGSNAFITRWDYKAQIIPNSSATGGRILKTGSQRLSLQGPGIYTGGVDVGEGVLRVLNDTALGSATNNAGTTVEPGASLELTGVTSGKGGLNVGPTIQGVPLTLYGTGNPTFGDSAVNVIAKDTQWTGPVSLHTSVEVSFQGTLANKPINTLVANYFDATGTNTLAGTNPTVTARTTTAGVTGANSAVQNLAFTGTVKTANATTISYFTLTYDDGVNPPVTSGKIDYDLDPNNLLANIANRLNPILGSNNYGLAMVSPTINVQPNARFVVTGPVDDGLATGIASPLIHDYTLNNTYADDPIFGGPALVPTGGNLGPTSYSFNAGGRAAHIGNNEGLTLTGALAPGANTYSLQMVCTIDELPPPAPTGYVRLIDWLTGAATADDGLYILDDFLTLYPGAASGPAGTFPGGPQTFNLIITRDGPTGKMQGYVNGNLQFNTVDVTNGVISPTGVLKFFLDDTTVVPDEISSGSVDHILIYNRELTATEVSQVSPNATTVGYLPSFSGTPSSSPADISLGSGGGELLLAGQNSYRGTTFANQGIVTVASNQGLGAAGVAGTQILKLTGAKAGTTKFQLTFGNATTAQINYTGVVGGAAGDVSAIKNALSPAFFTAAGFPGGTANVIQTNAGTFQITFGGTLAGTTTLMSAKVSTGPGSALLGELGGTVVADHAQVQLEGGVTVAGEPLVVQGNGNNLESTVQTFTVGTTAQPPLPPNGTYSLNFNTIALDPLTLSLGGTLTVGTPYYYVVTALTPSGESFVSNEQTITPVAGNQTVNLSWNQSTGATGYKIYRSTASGVYTNDLLATISGGTITSFIDGGLGVSPTAPPQTGGNTASIAYNASAQQVQKALQAVVNTVSPGGTVNVTQNGFDPGLNESQFITFTGLTPNVDQFQIYFDPSGAPSKVGVNLTKPITWTGNPFTDKDNILKAMNALQTVGGLSVGGSMQSGLVGVVTGGDIAGYTFVGGLGNSVQPFAVVTLLSPGLGKSAVVGESTRGAPGTQTFLVTFQGTLAQQFQPLMRVMGTTGAVTLNNLPTVPPPSFVTRGGTANATPIQWFTAGPAPVSDANVFNGVGGALQPTTGRVTGVDVQGQTGDDINISTAGGGFWKTIDGGQHWSQVFDSVNNSVMFSGATTIAQASATTTYYGTGEGNNSVDSFYGSGVYITSGPGQTPRLLTDPVLGNPLAGKAINKIAVNPNNTSMIWVAVSDFTVNGTTGNAGIWRYDGVNWLNMTTGFPNTSTEYMDVAYDVQANVLYAAFGDSFAGGSDILTCTSPTLAVPGVFTAANISAISGTPVGTIKLAVSTNGRAYAAITDANTGGLLAIVQTTDGGVTWAVVADVNVAKKNIPNYLGSQGWYDSAIVAWNRGGADQIFVGGKDQGGGKNFVLWSKNNGTAWTDISADTVAPPDGPGGPHTDVHALAFDPGHNLVVGSDGGVWRANIDYAAGALTTWDNLNGDLNTIEMNGIAVQPGNTGYILGGAQDNGTFLYDPTTGLWTQVDGGDGGLVRFVPTDSSVAYHVQNGSLRRSTDGGLTWGPSFGGASAGLYFPFAVDPSDPSRVVIGGSALRESLSQGTPGSYANLNAPAGGVSAVALADFQGTFQADPFFPLVTDVGANTYVPGTIYASNGTRLFVTRNHGLNWAGVSAAFPIIGASNTSPIVITSNNHGLSTGVKVTVTGVTGNTNANGTFTVTVLNPNQFSLDASGGNANYTGGGTWSLLGRTPPLSSGAGIMAITVDPSNSNIVYVVSDGLVGTAGAGRVFKSTDAGLSWTDISAGLPLQSENNSVLIAWNIVVDPRNNDLYIGTDKGVWKLTGGGGVWAPIGAGLPLVQVKDMQLDTTTNTLWAGTYGRGAWKFNLDDNALPGAPTNPGALRAIAGNNNWTGPVFLAGATTIAANGSQALQNNLSAATLTILGTISDTTVNATGNTLTKIGGGDVILSGANTFTGVTDVQQGNLVVHNPNALGNANLPGVQAVSVLTMSAPIQNAPKLSGGGTIPFDTTFFYQITAIGPSGESIASNEKTITTTAASQAVNLSWNQVNGATGYNIYRSTTAAPYASPAFLAFIPAGSITTYTDLGGSNNAGAPPSLRFTLSFNSFATGPINYTGIPTLDAAAVQAALSPAFFTSAGFAGGTASVAEPSTGVFVITFGGTLTGATQPIFQANLTSGVAVLSVTSGSGTVVESGAALVLETSLFNEPVTLNGNGILPTYSGHYTGALRSLSNANTYTGVATLNNNVTIGVDSGSSLNITNSGPIVITSANHGLASGENVVITGVVGDSAANGYRTVTVIDANHFSLKDALGNPVIGNGNYVSGGTWVANYFGFITAVSGNGVSPITITSAGHGLASGQTVTISGVGGNTNANGTFVVTVLDANHFTIPGTGNANYTGGGTWALVASGAITGATNAVSITDNGRGFGYDKEGAGMLTLGSAGTYGSATAGTTVDQGVVNVQNSQALGVAGTTTVVRDGAQLQLQAPNGAPISVANENLSLSGTGSSGTGALLNVSGNNTWGNVGSTITLTTNPGFAPITTPSGTVAIGVAIANDTLTIGSTIGEPTGAGTPTPGPLASGLSKVGPGRLTLAQNNTYTGTTYVNSGQLRIQASGALGTSNSNEIQRVVTFDALGTSTFSLTFNGQTTGNLAYGILGNGGVGPTTSIENALAALTGVGVGNVTVTRSTITQATPNGPQVGYAYTVTFGGALAGKDQPIIIANPTGGLKIAVSTVADGGVGTLVSPGASLEVDGDPTHTNNAIAPSDILVLNGTGSSAIVPITDISEGGAGGATAFVTVASTAGLYTGETVTIAGMTPAGYNGTFAITVVDDTHFTYDTGAFIGTATTLGFATPNAGALRNVSGDNFVNGNIILQTDTSIGVDPNTTLSVFGSVKDPAASTIPNPIPPSDLTKVGTGNLSFNNGNTYTGNTFVNTGVLTIWHLDSLGSNTSAIQMVSVFGTNLQYQLNYNGTPTSTLTLSSTAADVKAALDAVVQLANPSNFVTVTQAGANYTVYFNGGALAAKDQPLLTFTPVTGVGSVTITPIQLGAESDTVVAAGATLALQSPVGFTESSGKRLIINGQGFNGLGALRNISGNNTVGLPPGIPPLILGSTSAIGADAGSHLAIDQQVTDTFERQFIDFVGFSAGRQYTLTFDGATTGVITFSNSVATNINNITTLLNALPTIALRGGVVSVTNSNTTYIVSFGGRMIGTVWSNIVGTPVTTGAINVGSNMNSAAYGVNKVGAGNVQFTGGFTNVYTGLTDVNNGVLELNKTGGALAMYFRALLQVGDATLVGEVQSLDLSSFNYGDQFTLTFKGSPASAPLTYYTNPTYEAALIESALNSLSTVGGQAGSMTVVPNGANKFLITLGGSLAGPRPFSAIKATNTTTPSTVNASQVSAGSLPVRDHAQLLWQASDQVATDAFYTVNDDGQLNLGGFAQTIGAPGGVGLLAIMGGDVLLPAGSNLTLGDATFGGRVVAQSDIVGSALIRGAGQLTLASPFPASFFVAPGLQTSDLIISSVLADSGQGLVKSGSGRLEFAVTEATTYTGPTRVDQGDVQVDGLASTQVLSLTGAIAGITKIALTFNGATSIPFTYTGGGAADQAALKNALVTLGVPPANVTVTPDVTDTIFTIVFTTLMGPFVPAITSAIGTGNASVTLPNNIRSVVLNGGSISGTGAVSSISMAAGGTGTVNAGYNGLPLPTGILNVNGNVNWTPNTTFFVNLGNGSGTHPIPVVGSDYDQLNIIGNVNLGNALLDGFPLGGLQLGDSFTILQATGTITGQFDGILGATRGAIAQDGSAFIFGQKYTVHYYAHSVVLTHTLANFQSFTMAVDHNPSVYGQEVAYTVTAVPEPGATLASADPSVTFNLDNLYTQVVPMNKVTGVATFTPQAQFGLQWAPGVSHVISATFSDAQNVFQNANPTPNPINQTVNQNTVSVGIVSPTTSATTPVYAQTSVFTAIVTPIVTPDVAGASRPTANVTFVLDPGINQQVFSIPILNPANGQATLTLPGNMFLAPGNHVVTASYDGDTNYTASPAPTVFNFIVFADATVVSFTPAPTPSNLGQNATFYVVVNPALVGSTGLPVGTINLYDGSTSNPPLNSSPISYAGGTAVFTTSNLLVGPHNIIATFTPSNVNYLASSTSKNFTVNPATTVTAITSFNPSSPTYGQQVSFNVAVVRNPIIASSYGLPTGNVTLWLGPVGNLPTDPGYLGTGAINSGTGLVTITTAPFGLPFGTDTINAHYVGDGQFGPSTGTVIVNVGQAPTNTALSASPPGSQNWGQNVILTATVSSPNGTPPVGAGSTVTFFDVTTSTTLGVRNLAAGGIATLTTNVLTAASHTIRATYNDTFDNNFGSSIGTLNNYVVAHAPTTVTSVVAAWSTSPTAPVYAQPVTLTATVTSPGGTITVGAGSSVKFVDNNTGATLGTGNIVAGGMASIVTNALIAATHTITATYTDTADTFFNTSNGTLTNFTVTAAPTIISSFTSSAPGNTLGLGAAVTYTATVVTLPPSDGSTVKSQGTVTFTDNGVPIGTPVSVNANGIASVNVTYTTLAQTGFHTIRATYNAPTIAPINYQSSAQVQLTQNVLRASTVNTAAVANTYGQDLVYTVTVTSPQGGVPTGDVMLTEGATILATGTLAPVGGVATVVLNVPGGTLNAGNHNLVFRYQDTTVTPVYADGVKNITQNVAGAGTTVNFSPAPQTTAVYGTTVTYDGNVTTTAVGGINPTDGTVTLKDNNTNAILGTFTLIGSNAFSFSNVSLPLNVNIGSHTISATFTPANPNYVVSPARTSALSVTQAFTQVSTPTSSVTSGPLGGSYYGQAVQFSVNVTSTNSPATPVGGTVSFFLNGATLLGTVNLVGGSASYTTTATRLGVNTGAGNQITAKYNSSNPASPTTANFKASTASTPWAQFVSPAATAVTVTSSLAGGSIFGQSITYTAVVSIASPGSPGVPTATSVTFRDGATTLGTVTVATVNATARTLTYKFTTSALTAIGSPHAISATYNGATNFAQSTDSLSQTVTAATTLTTMTSTPALWASDTNTTFTAVVTRTNGAGALNTGGATLKFMEGATTVGTGTLIATTATTATYRFTTLTPLSAGPHTINAEYSGNGNIAGSVSTPVTQDVHKFSALTIAASAAPTTGSLTTFTMTFKGAGGVPIANASLTLTINGTTFNLLTNGSGVATMKFTFATAGTYTVTGAFGTDGFFNDAFAKATLVVKTPVTGRLV